MNSASLIQAPSLERKVATSVFTLETMAGLCNRLRTIDGVISLAAEKSGQVHVLWFCDSEVNCRFTELFEPLSGAVRFWHFDLTPRVERWAKRLIHAGMKRTCNRYLIEPEVSDLLEQGCEFSELTTHRRVFLKTWKRIGRTKSSFAMFRPTKKYRP